MLYGIEDNRLYFIEEKIYLGQLSAVFSAVMLMVLASGFVRCAHISAGFNLISLLCTRIEM